jgi:transcriptional regulator, propionate catabolism operon regulatory protein
MDAKDYSRFKMRTATATPTLPRIAVISYKGLSRLAHSLIPSYQGRAEIQIVDKLFDEAVEVARELDRRREVDVFVSAGANGAYLRDSVARPVVQIQVTGLDLLRALLKSRKFSGQIALVTYRQRNIEFDEVKQLLDLDVEQRSYTTIDDAKEQFQELAARGYKVIIGSSLVVELAERQGLTGILVYSSHSIDNAFEGAVEICHIARAEEARTERLNAILRHIDAGVVAVDADERIQSLNPALESLIGLAEHDALGKRLSELAPELSLARTIQSGATEVQQIERHGHRTIVTNRIPITSNGAVTGAVLTFQDAHTIERADRNIRAQNRAWNMAARYQLANAIGVSPAMRRARNLALQYAKTDATMLITGESGTGKELFAQGVHNASRRRNRPFVAINCAAIPESLLESELFGHEEGSFTGSRRGGKTGLFEIAHTGTIFLDEIGDMPKSLQPRLLRVLQEKEVLRVGGSKPVPIDVRVVAATNRDLKRCVADREFREDLYYRLNILHLHIPPLRDRREDVPELLRHLLHQASQKLGSKRDGRPLLEALLPTIEEYSWPGNAREVENVAERLAVFYTDADVEAAADAASIGVHIRDILPELFSDAALVGKAPRSQGSLKMFRYNRDAAHIERTLAECGGNVGAAARQLGISRTTLWRKLKGNGKPHDHSA